MYRQTCFIVWWCWWYNIIASKSTQPRPLIILLRRQGLNILLHILSDFFFFRKEKEKASFPYVCKITFAWVCYNGLFKDSLRWCSFFFFGISFLFSKDVEILNNFINNAPSFLFRHNCMYMACRKLLNCCSINVFLWVLHVYNQL